MGDEAKRQRDEEERRMKEEEERKHAESEFLRFHREQKKLGRDMAGSTSSLADISESDGDSRKRVRGDRDSPEKMKRKKVDLDEEEDEGEFGEDPLKNITLGLDLLKDWLNQPSLIRLVTKPQQKKFNKIMNRIREEVTRSREERAKTETREEEKSSLTEVIKKAVREEIEKVQGPTRTPGMPSYAAALGTKEAPPKVPRITGVKGPVQPAPKLVIVKQDGKESKEVEATLKRLVKPSEIGLKVKRLGTIRNGVIIEAEDNVGVDNLLQHQGLKDAGLQVGKPTKKSPVVMIYDVNKDLSDEEIREEIYAKNSEGSGVEEEEFKKEFVVRHRYRDERSRGKKCHIVVECSARVRNWLRGRERVFIEWQSCRVKDYVDVARCYKCQRYGHVAKYCSSEKPDCSFCAGEHDFKDCKVKTKKENARCINCQREGREDNKHDAGWRGCPSYERAVKRQNEKIDYV